MDDAFEDDADPDLDISKVKDKVWLVKLPKWLMEHWSKTDEDNVELAGIHIHTASSGTSGSHIKLVLPDNAANANIPKEFTVNMTNRKVSNTYVFSERDLQIKSEPAAHNGTNRFTPYPKPPPKATSIVGTVAHECTVTPVMNASYSRTVKSRVQEANIPKRQVQMLTDNQGIPDGSYLYNPKSNQPFGKFTGGGARTKAEAQNNKATRIPKNELLDLLFKCFQEYEYWSLKGLKEYVKQPESYLREVLEEIALLNKRGAYALKWSLKPHYNQNPRREGQNADLSANQMTKEEPKAEEDVKMEDIR